MGKQTGQQGQNNTKESGGQPAPLSGSKKVKNQNHSRAKKHSSSDM